MKTRLGAKNVLYPSLTTLIGAHVHGKPNFITIAHVGILSLSEISFGLHRSHYSNEGIRENECFSVNIPSEDMVIETDYVGLVSGRDTDKSGLFELFYGELPAAPMIKKCPLCMECRLIRVLELPHHDVFVGEAVETYADESVLTDGKVDVGKVRPLLFDMPLKKYWRLGGEVAGCWRVGREHPNFVKKKES